MKLYDFDWEVVIQMAPVWKSMPVEDRCEFMDMDSYAQSRVPESMTNAYEKVMQTTLDIDRAGPGQRIVPRIKEFWRYIRHFRENPYFDDIRDKGLDIRSYLKKVFTRRELVTFARPGTGKYEVFDAGVDGQLSDPDWVVSFLECEDRDVWERGRLGVDEEEYFTSDTAFKLAKQLVEKIAEKGGPVRISDLEVDNFDDSVALLSEILRACVRYVLLIPTMKGDNLDIQIGVWPSVLRMLNREPAEPPKSVEPVDTFYGAPLMEDMTAVLVECMTDTVRLRANDNDLFKRHRERIEENVAPVPEWVQATFDMEGYVRTDSAVEALGECNLVQVAGEPGEDYRLEATDEGGDWLKKSSGKRLKGLIDILRDGSDETDYYSRWGRPFRFVPGWVDIVNSDVIDHIREAFESIDGQEYVGYADFLDYAAREHNPFIGMSSYELSSFQNGYWGIGGGLNQEDCENQCHYLIDKLFRRRLVPLAGVRVGADERDQLVLQLEDPGRYLLGMIEDFDYGADEEADILVQPNYEVTFLAPSPGAESDIGRFAERIGHNVGVLFKITRESIFDAAAAGMEADDALSILRNASSQAVPDNVEREIKGWFSRCRNLTARRALLVTCPDEETAARMVSAGGKHVEKLSDRVVELPTGRKRKRTLRKLRENGLFVEE